MQNLHIHGYDVGVDSWEKMSATSVQADKVVNVRMSESEHTAEGLLRFVEPEHARRAS